LFSRREAAANNAVSHPLQDRFSERAPASALWDIADTGSTICAIRVIALFPFSNKGEGRLS
jgi:hypothetical protein